MTEKIEINISTSLQRFRLGGTPMLIANVKKRKSDIMGVAKVPLFLEIVRVCDEL